MSGEEIENYDEEAEGENYYGEAEGEDGLVGEGEEPEGMFIIEGADGEIYMADELPNGQTLEEAMGHTNTTDEEEKKWSESGDNDFHVDDISVGQFREHNDHIYTIAQHPTMPHIFLSGGGDDKVLVWDIKGDQKDKNTILEIKEGFKDSIEYIKFSADSKYLLISGMGNPIRIYKVEEHEGIPSFEFKKEMETGDDISFINWHPKANLFLTGGNDMMVWMFNALNGEFTTYAGHEDAINNAEFTPDGKQIVSISNDQSVKVWNPRTTKCMQTIQGEMYHKNPIISMFMINQSIVTGDSEGYIYIAQYKTGEMVGPVTKHSEAVESIKGNSPKSVAWGSLDGTIKIIDVGKQCMAIDIPKLDDGSGITRMYCSPINPYLYAASTCGSLYKIDIRSGEMLKKYTAHRDSIMDFVVDEENGKIVTAGDDKVAYIFDI